MLRPDFHTFNAVLHTLLAMSNTSPAEAIKSREDRSQKDVSLLPVEQFYYALMGLLINNYSHRTEANGRLL